MNIFVSHASALEFWRGGRLQKIGDCSRSLPQPGQAPSRKDLAAFDFSHFGIYGEPIHLMVAGPDERIQAKRFVTHDWNKACPSRSFIQAGRGFYVISPALCLIQMAAEQSVPRLVLLGLELCGSYRIDKESPRGFRSADPITRAQDLRSVIENCGGLYGYRRARRASRYIVDGCASPMEALLVALLCLPPSLGGYGIELPLINYRVDLRNRSKGAAATERRFCDLCWPQAHLAAEYDSKMFHEDLGREGHDSARRTALELEDMHIVSVTKDQVGSVSKFDELAQLLAKRLGKPLRIRQKDFLQRRAALRRDLWPFTFDMR